MEFIGKARIRIEHWVSHNEHHHEEYGAFVKQLEEAGKPESAKCIREMMEFTEKGTQCLRKALSSL